MKLVASFNGYNRQIWVKSSIYSNQAVLTLLARIVRLGLILDVSSLYNFPLSQTPPQFLKVLYDKILLFNIGSQTAKVVIFGIKINASLGLSWHFTQTFHLIVTDLGRWNCVKSHDILHDVFAPISYFLWRIEVTCHLSQILCKWSFFIKLFKCTL